MHQGDAIAWLNSDPSVLQAASIITSLPDLSEIPTFDLAAWQRWFIDAAALIGQKLASDGVAVFFQSDIMHAGEWIDKSALVAQGAERAGLRLLFHKIVCRLPPGAVTFGRASYAHLVAYGRQPLASLRRATADVIADGGEKPGTRAMGTHACAEAVKFVIAETPTRTVVDPFCGYGTVLAVANAHGLAAVGVDLSTRMCRRARQLIVDKRGTIQT